MRAICLNLNNNADEREDHLLRGERTSGRAREEEKFNFELPYPNFNLANKTNFALLLIAGTLLRNNSYLCARLVGGAQACA